jgi:hypothetical protein
MYACLSVCTWTGLAVTYRLSLAINLAINDSKGLRPLRVTNEGKAPVSTLRSLPLGTLNYVNFWNTQVMTCL